MTILDATSLLFGWFKDNDSFESSKDFSKLVLVTDNPQRDKAAVILALENLQESEILKKKELDEKVYWILNKPFETYEQTVNVSPVLAASIAKVVNDYCEYLEDQTEMVDPTNIKEKDIQNMLYICTKFLEDNS
jgi:hypothetical protein